MTPTQKINLNFLVDNLGATQTAFTLIDAANKIADEGWASPIIFYDQLQRDCRVLHVSAMNMMEAWRQEGVTVATSFVTLQALMNMPGPQVKMFYVWDMSWIDNPKEVGYFRQFFSAKGLILIARCEDHKAVIENNFNIKVGYVFENFDTEKMREAVQDEFTRSAK